MFGEVCKSSPGSPRCAAPHLPGQRCAILLPICYMADTHTHTHRNRITDMQCAQKLPILTTAINSIIHGGETAGF